MDVPGNQDYDREMDAELERRLAILESVEYEDAARKDLPAADYVGLVVLNLVLILLFYAWGAF